MAATKDSGDAQIPPMAELAVRVLWRTVLTGNVDAAPIDRAVADGVRALAARLAVRCSAGWGASLLAPLAARLDVPLIDSTAAKSSSLLSRLAFAAQTTALRRMLDAGLHPVALKGFANAHLLYDPPASRIVGDLDLLLPRAEIGAAIDLFLPLGYRFGGERRTPWGFNSDASYVPFYSPDGVTNIDLHVEPDAWPLPRGLSADEVLTQARTLLLPGGAIGVPCDEHVFLICVSNIAKDRFGWQTLSKVIDAARLLLRRGSALDWTEIDRRAARAGLARPLSALLALLVTLGVVVPPAAGAVVAPRGLAGRTWRHVLADWQAVFPNELSAADLMWRDLTLAQTPATFARLNWRRLKGLVRRDSGVPPEARARGLA